MKKPFLTGETICLRPIEESDLNENYRDWFNDEEICRHNSHHRFPNYNENMEAYFRTTIQSENNLVLAIADKETDKHIGNISLQNIDATNRSAEFAIIVGDKDYWGKGVGKEAAGLIIDHGFKQLNLHRIYCGTSEDNVAMRKLAELLGFTEEGIGRECFFKNGQYRSSINYSILENEHKNTGSKS
ncbi:MAG: GNAT family protein [Patescibacteria group bacterium]|nr:GNAT family N-acetyltransferase [Patescibacteria group bacterium]